MNKMEIEINWKEIEMRLKNVVSHFVINHNHSMLNKT